MLLKSSMCLIFNSINENWFFIFFYLDHQKGYKQWWFTKLIPKICITTPNKTNLFLGRFLIALDILFLMLLYYKNNTTNQDNIDFKY